MSVAVIGPGQAAVSSDERDPQNFASLLNAGGPTTPASGGAGATLKRSLSVSSLFPNKRSQPSNWHPWPYNPLPPAPAPGSAQPITAAITYPHQITAAYSPGPEPRKRTIGNLTFNEPYYLIPHPLLLPNKREARYELLTQLGGWPQLLMHNPGRLFALNELRIAGAALGGRYRTNASISNSARQFIGRVGSGAHFIHRARHYAYDPNYQLRSTPLGAAT